MEAPDKIVEAFGLTLKDLRENAGLSQEKLAEHADLERTFISWLETGKKQPTITTIFKVSHALNITPSEFLLKVQDKIKIG